MNSVDLGKINISISFTHSLCCLWFYFYYVRIAQSLFFSKVYNTPFHKHVRNGVFDLTNPRNKRPFPRIWMRISKERKYIVVVGEWIYQANKMVKIPKKRRYVYKRLEYVASSNLLGSQKKSLLKSQQCDAHIYTQWI